MGYEHADGHMIKYYGKYYHIPITTFHGYSPKFAEYPLEVSDEVKYVLSPKNYSYGRFYYQTFYHVKY